MIKIYIIFNFKHKYLFMTYEILTFKLSFTLFIIILMSFLIKNLG